MRKMGTVEIKLASTSRLGWVDFESAASVAVSEVSDARKHGKRNQWPRMGAPGTQASNISAYLSIMGQMELPSRCAGPQPGSLCLGGSLVQGWHLPVPGSGPLSASGVSEGQPHTPHWVLRAVTRTWGCRESSCCSGSLLLTALSPRHQAVSAYGTAPSLVSGRAHVSAERTLLALLYPLYTSGSQLTL